MRILVLGASGFMGRHLLPLLSTGGHTVVALARHPPPASASVVPISSDVLAPGAIEQAVEGCQAVINLVGLNHEHGVQTFERLHVELVSRMVAAAEAAKLSRLVQVSVLASRPDPRSPYHDTKHRSDERVKQSSVPWVIVRPGIVFGADDQFTTRIEALIATRLVPLPGGGTALHAPLHVDDLAQALLHALVRPELAGEVLPLTGPRTLSYREIVHELVAQSGHWAWTPAMPVWLVRLAAALSSWMPVPPVTAAQVTMLTDGMAADTAAVWDRLGIAPRPFAPRQLLDRSHGPLFPGG